MPPTVEPEGLGDNVQSWLPLQICKVQKWVYESIEMSLSS
jgi:hypothetical protein